MAGLTQEEIYFNRMQSGDVKSFEYFFKTYIDQLYAYAIGFVKEKSIAEDIIQDTFIYFWNNKSKITCNGTVYGYLQRSVRNACINIKEHEQVKQKYQKEILSIQKESYEIWDYDELDKKRQQILNAIDQLPEKSRSIFMMSVIEGKKYKEIALLKGISENTVKSQIRLTYRRLRDNLGLSRSDLLFWVLIFFTSK